MKKRTFLIIVIFTAVSLGGIIFIQFFWIRNAIELQEKQFDAKVMISLKSIVNEMYECKNDTCEGSLFCTEECSHRMEGSHFRINRLYLDSLIRAEFHGMGLQEPYVYGIINTGNQKVSLVSDTAFRTELLNTRHAVSLSCIYRSSDRQLAAWFPDEDQRALKNILWWLVLCFVLIGGLVFGLSYTIYSFVKQKRLSEMKSDFVNNMTHEFKTPIATISLASEMLLKPAIIGSADKAKKYASIIFDENQRLRNQVEHILQIAVLDREEFQLKFHEVDLHEIIDQLVDQFDIWVKEKGGTLTVSKKAETHILMADAMHIRNIISNLLDNACKYSPSKPTITLSTSSTEKGVTIMVEDKGIGISAENQKHIFKKLYRVPTGNVHDVKGFGLGLFYVKTMVEAHGGSIRLWSEPGTGSRFEIFMPFKQQGIQS